MGVHRNLPEQPEILAYLDQMQFTGHLIWKGGLSDQPYIFMIELKKALEKKTLFEMLLREIRQSNQPTK
jgi:hypothetical protein